ncbi:hypothetical protein J7K24_02715 [bacterium]|nr:hypothetical protein [bacterium]
MIDSLKKQLKSFLVRMQLPESKKLLLHIYRIKRQIRRQFDIVERLRKEMESVKLSFALLPKPDEPRYFVIIRPGHCGSLWLTKLLNSHPDVLCFHEGALQKVFPFPYWRVTEEDCLAWIYSLVLQNHYHKIYKAIGDIGSITPEMVRMPEVNQRFKVFGLTRNGILYVRSQLPKKNLPKQLRILIDPSVKKAVKRFPQLSEIEDKFKTFIFCCYHWLEYIEAPTVKTFRIEDFNDPRKAVQMFYEITGLSDVPYNTLERMMNQRINRHVDTQEYNPYKVYTSEWSEEQRFIFDTICGEKMREWYGDY